tara:strand:- start:5050 stop:5256 length:207 start_codon:yes stop_codon:yes gene_type:complete
LEKVLPEIRQQRCWLHYANFRTIICALWPRTVQIGSHRLTDVGGQRQSLNALPLTVNDDLAGPSINII